MLVMETQADFGATERSSFWPESASSISSSDAPASSQDFTTSSMRHRVCGTWEDMNACVGTLE